MSAAPRAGCEKKHRPRTAVKAPPRRGGRRHCAEHRVSSSAMGSGPIVSSEVRHRCPATEVERRAGRAWLDASTPLLAGRAAREMPPEWRAEGGPSLRASVARQDLELREQPE